MGSEEYNNYILPMDDKIAKVMVESGLKKK